ncbi:MAG: glycosyltransferase family 4 protein [Anaerolineae bacterium]
MPHYILDARTATPHFPGIGRYVANLAANLIPLLAADERLTILYDPAHPLALPPSEAVRLVPAPVSPFSLRQQWALPQLIRELGGCSGPEAARRPPSGLAGLSGPGEEPAEASIPANGPGGQLAKASIPADGLGEEPAKASIPAQHPRGHGTSAAGVIYHSPYYLMPYRPGAATVLTVYDLIPLRHPEHSTARARLLFRWATALALRTARVVIAISDFTRRDFLAEFHLAPEHIAAIPLAADPIFRPQPAEAVAAVRARYNLPAQYALYVGSNKPHKNLVRLLEAWQMAHGAWPMADSRLVIAGAWDARYPEAKERAEALGLGDQVMFLGPVAEADLPALYAGATLFVFPSLYEGFGLPVLEAMACGTPVICARGSSLPEVAGDAAWLVDPLDVAGLAEALARLWSDPALRAGLQQRGLAQAQRFSWQATAQQTLLCYRALAKNPALTHLLSDAMM